MGGGRGWGGVNFLESIMNNELIIHVTYYLKSKLGTYLAREVWQVGEKGWLTDGMGLPVKQPLYI